MYSFFELSGSTGVRLTAAAGSLIIAALVLATTFMPASPTTTLTIGALA